MSADAAVKSRKPAIVACVLLALALAGMAFTWQWLRWDSEWLRFDPETVPDTQSPWVYVVVRADDAVNPDDRYDDVKIALIASITEVLKSAPHEGHYGSREWPKAYSWYGLWAPLPQGLSMDEALSRLHKDMMGGLHEQTRTLRWRAAVVDPEGRTRTTN